MTTHSPRIYVYKITFEEVPYYYYGVHKEKKFDEEYWGSPITNKWCWELYTPKKQILELFDYSDEGWLKALDVEERLIRPFFNTDKWCLNENVAGKMSLDILSKAGKMGYKKGIMLMTEEKRKEAVKKSYETNKTNKTGLFSLSLEEIKKNAKLGGDTCKSLGVGYSGLTTEERIKYGRKSYELGVGIHALTPEQKSENGKRGALTNKQNNTGLYGRSIEEIREHSSIGGKESKRLKKGVHGRTKEQQTKDGKKGAKVTNSQRWMCLETGFITNPGNLTKYQRKRGIDTSKRVKVS